MGDGRGVIQCVRCQARAWRPLDAPPTCVTLTSAPLPSPPLPPCFQIVALGVDTYLKMLLQVGLVTEKCSRAGLLGLHPGMP